jgi:hypothetical protein
MIKSLLLGTVLGGLAAFLWSSFSWGVLPWHEKALLNFQNEDGVASAISANAIRSGVYLLPAGPAQGGMTAEERKAAQAALTEKFQKGPVMFAAIRRDGFGSYPRVLISQFLCQMAAAFLLTWLLLHTQGLTYGRRVLFLGACGLAASVIADLPNWNWWGFSGAYTAVNLADYTLTWLLAGVIIAGVAKPRRA